MLQQFFVARAKRARTATNTSVKRGLWVLLMISACSTAVADTVPVATETSAPITPTSAPTQTVWATAFGTGATVAESCSSAAAYTTFVRDFGSNVVLCGDASNYWGTCQVSTDACAHVYNSGTNAVLTVGCLPGYTQSGSSCNWTGPANTCKSGTYDAASGQCVDSKACPRGSYVLDPGGTTCSAPDGIDTNVGICLTTDRPVTIANGNKLFNETDYVDAGPGRLNWRRTYNSLINRQAQSSAMQGAALSSNWTHPYSRAVATQTIPARAVQTMAYVYRPDGSLRAAQLDLSGMTFINGHQVDSWSLGAGASERLTRVWDVGGGNFTWTYYAANPATVETYDRNGILQSIAWADGVTHTMTYSDGTAGANGGYVLDGNGNATTFVLPAGRLIRVTDNFGRSLNLGYGANARITKVTPPDGQSIRYSYGVFDLASAIYPDGKQRQYVYNEPNWTGSANLPHAITGLVDETGNRLGSFQYEASGRAIQSQWWAGGWQSWPVDRSTFSFGAGGASTTVTDGLGSSRTYNFTTINGRQMFAGQSQPGGAGCGPASSSVSYDANNNATRRVDFNNNVSCYGYDTTRNLETARVEGLASGVACPANVASYTPAANTPQRLIQTQWHPTWRLATRVAEPNKITTLVYNGQPDPTNGNAIASCAPGGAVIDIDAKPIAVLCKVVEQATTDNTGASGFSATATGTARVTKFTYNAAGQLLTVTGPRGNLVTTDPNYAADVTTFAYYATTDTGHTPPWYRAGDLQTVTNALSHVTQFNKYDGAGRPLTIVDANSQTTTLAYNLRGWLTSRTVAGESTSFGYNDAGDVTLVTFPDSSSLGLGYDVAHRLTSVADNLNNRIDYTLDALGNRTAETRKDPAGTLKQSLSRAIDALNRVQTLTAAPSTPTASSWAYQFDANGNGTQTTDPRTQNANQQFDALNRLTVQLQPAPQTGGTRPQGSFAYDGRDALKQATDPRSLATTYTVDGLGNLTQEVSPDRGTTTKTYDVAGNVKTSVDARNKTTTYTYDALNRLTQASYATGTATVYTYDGGTNGKGRLTGITDESGSTAFTYNAQGRVLTKTNTFSSGAKTRTTTYVYGTTGSANGHVVSVTYPSANRINYAYDAAGRVSSLTLNPTNSNGVGTNTGTTVTLLSGITYQPFGPISGWTWGASGSGHTVAKTFDLNGRMTSYPLGDPAQSGLVRTVVYDAANRITGYTHVNGSGVAQPAFDQGFSYDNINRLTSFTASSTSGAYTLDSSGNRSSHTVNGTIYSDSIAPTSNRLTSTSGPAPAETNTFDAAGNITGNGTWTATISDRGRMKSLTIGGNTISYFYDGLEQRATKSGPTAVVPTGKAYYVYDEADHLIGEYDANTTVIEETVYLGDVPVIVITQSGAPPSLVTTVQNVSADHLNAPQVVTRASDHVMRWRWMPDPFGTANPNENPASVGAFVYNPRGMGLLYDKESGLFYNMNRYAVPGDGRYLNVDPIGLAGGSWSPYTWLNGDPLTNVDPLGLTTYMCTKPLHALGERWGSRLYPESRLNPSPLYHQYICVPDGKGGMVCGGQDRADGPWGPGKPSDDSFDLKSCKPVDEKKCVEECLLPRVTSPNRPAYSLFGGGGRNAGSYNCQQWADKQVQECKQQCKGR